MECGKVREIWVALPPPDEQNRIIAFLDEQSSRLRAAIKRIEDGIARLQEYRTALISAAVTGQIDVYREVES
jgi:type I restriction enzyme S subunit